MLNQTIDSLVTRIVILLGQVPGSANVTQYAVPKVKEFIRQRYEQLWIENTWIHLQRQVTITYTSGVPSPLPSSYITTYNDITGIYIISSPNYSVKPLPQLPLDVNSNLFKGSAPRFVVPNSTYIFSLIPSTIADNTQLIMQYKYGSPGILDLASGSSILPLDDLLIIYAVCLDYCIDDNANDLQVKNYQQKFTDRLAQLISAENNQRIPINYREAAAPSNSNWWTQE